MKIYRLLFVGIAVVVSVSTVFAAEKRFNVPLAGSPSLGPADAPVTIVEFLDYQ